MSNKAHKSTYKLNIFKMIEQGYTNRQIWEQLGCNIKYPAILRREWQEMTDAEKDEIMERWKPKPREPKPAAKQDGFRTPYSQAKGRYYPSRY